MVKLMFSEGQKLEAVKLFKKTGSLAVAIRIPGYPKNGSSLRNWVNGFKKAGIYEKSDVTDLKIYSQEEMDFACEYYDECEDLKRTVEDLGYPSDISVLHWWVSSRDKPIVRKRRSASRIHSPKEKI